VRRANFRFVRIIPNIAKSTPLTQEVPALIQFDSDLCEPLAVWISSVLFARAIGVLLQQDVGYESEPADLGLGFPWKPPTLM
jgi:hypothetical protein